MKRIALLSSNDLNGFVSDEHLLVSELEISGFKAEIVPWDKDHDWSIYEAAIIRTTWDYMKRLPEFMERIKIISDSTKLLNPYEVVEWNSHKKYLSELKAKGVLIVPTAMFKHPEKPVLPEEWSYDKYIIKPAISAGAYKTMVISKQDLESHTYAKDLFPGDWMLQPFLEEIKQGEISIIFFDRKYSHSIIKVPKEDEFRCQEEYGGNVTLFNPDEELIGLAQRICDLIPHDLLYGRVDLVRFQDSYALMELELIEPSLFFRKDPTAPKRLCEALQKYL